MNRTEITKSLLNKGYLIQDTYTHSLDVVSYDTNILFELFEEVVVITINYEETHDTKLTIDYDNLTEDKLTQILSLLKQY